MDQTTQEVTAEMAKSRHHAIAYIIRQTGFTAMSEQYMDAPHYRPRIVTFIAKQLTERGDADLAKDFTRCALEA